jgi:DNA-binding transcriptional LysR family regulator
LNLHALRVFTEVAKAGSVTRAGETLLISQPAVTAQVRNLEKELQIKLVVPKGRAIELTAAGEMLFRYGLRLFSLEKEIEQKMKEAKEGRTGQLRICATNLPARALLPKWTIDFKKKHPTVDIQLTKGNTEFAFKQLLHYEIDIAIVAGGWEHEEIESSTIFENELLFIVANEHKLGHQQVFLSQLARESFVYREDGSATRKKLISLFQTKNFDPPPIGLEMEGLYESIEAVKLGYGIMLAPKFAVKNELENNEVAPIFVHDVQLSLPIKLYKRKGEALSPVASRFTSFLQSYREEGSWA